MTQNTVQLTINHGSPGMDFPPSQQVGLSEVLKKISNHISGTGNFPSYTYEVQDFDPTAKRRKIKDIVHRCRNEAILRSNVCKKDLFGR
ncbi:hypothetical protein AVEN_136230-1 [Araneus ventricosus]|uniref:Uncharacterized protein n=1 Tax=Araneus ventricosus TaxID=182803 RepID=A0A4Y2MYA5_ARAVE|nr:hypothetical protein AVEN_136230-1 [Araneus ventricosus]